MKRRRSHTRRSARPAPARPQGGQPDGLLRYATLPLRLFLGATFLYAGLQKVSDPGYLAPGASTYIGSQLQGFAAHSPIGFLLTGLAIPLAVPVGVTVLLAEIAIGLLVLAGVLTRWAAVVGALLSFVLFLTASWSVQPYFLGSDSIYAVAWVTLALAGDQGVLSLAGYLRGRPAAPFDPDRRALLLRAGGMAVAAVWLLAILPRPRSGGTAAVGAPAASNPGATPTPRPPAAPPAATPPPGGTRVGTMSQLEQNGGSLAFRNPSSGDPGVAVGLGSNRVVAYDAVCTHAGCTVGYEPSDHMLVCPCHGAVFDPAHGAQVQAGPAPQPLAQIQVVLAADGGIYAL